MDAFGSWWVEFVRCGSQAELGIGGLNGVSSRDCNVGVALADATTATAPQPEASTEQMLMDMFRMKLFIESIILLLIHELTTYIVVTILHTVLKRSSCRLNQPNHFPSLAKQP